MEKNLGHATAYGYAKSKGYSGTEEEFAQLMANYASVGQSAAQSAEQAAASATSASGSAATATQAAQTATSKASEAVTAADTATTKASEANASADTASAAATSAGTSAQTATTAAATATTKASEASESATTASTAKTDAESARDAAAQSASEAAASAESIDPETLEHRAYGAYVVESASGAVASFPDGADSIPMKDVLVHIEPVQAGSGDPSPDNVRPITGWTGAKVTRTGKNLYPILIGADMFTTNGGASYSNDNGKLIINTVSSNQASGVYLSPRAELRRIIETFDAPLTVSMDIEASASGSVRTIFCGVQDLRTITNSKQRVSITAMEKSQINFNIYGANNGATLTVSNLQVELGSTATDYEPYSGQTYDITFPSEAWTVYGGTLDVTGGVLTVDRAMVDLGTLDWRYFQNGVKTKYYFRTTNEITNAKPSNGGIPNCVSNRYKATTWSATVDSATTNNCITFGWSGKSYIAVCDDAYTDTAEFTAAMSGVQLVYELATPITYQLTPQEITSLLGVNNLWADTGDSEVEYRANTKLYIDNKIAELQALVLENNGGN